MVLLKEAVPGKERLDALGELKREFTTNICPAIRDNLRSGYADLYPQMLAKAPHYLGSNRLDVDDFSMKMWKNYGDDCDKKPAGNQGEVSAAGNSEGKAESAGPGDKSIPQSRKDGSSPPAEEVPPENEFQVISPESIGVAFKDIGGLNETKRSLEELVMLPLKRPELFKGALSKTCRGILLFGPPGTGKTMLAKAIATEAKASFINCSMSAITSNVPGEAEKNVRALFSLAAEVAPTIIFVDDVDRMLAKRKHGEPEFMRILKNEFMSNWDGFMTKPGEKILVLGATNRPFDLDEAAIRRFERRLMVGLPSAEDREEILTFFLSKQKTEGIHIHELARTTGGYTGSDLENLCNTALRRPICDFIERLNDLERKRAQERENLEGGSQAKEDNTEKEEETITSRALTMEDMEEAKKRVAPSFAVEGALMTELKQWNELYGGGSRKKEPLTYLV